MNIKRIAQFAGVAAAIPMLLLANTSNAFADGFKIKWADAATQGCLDWEFNNVSYRLLTSFPPAGLSSAYCINSDHNDILWDDTQGNVQDQDGTYWKESPAFHDDVCLTAYWGTAPNPGMAYLEPCTSPAN